MPFSVARVEIFSASILDQAFTNDIVGTAEAAFSKYLENCGLSGVTVNSTYANSGHDSADYVAKLPNLLTAISGVPNVCVIMHGPGNDITNNGPYPGGASTMQSNMTTVASGITGAGHKLMWGPISYRIPPGSHPADPYNQNIINPLAQTYSPDFYSAGTPIFDMYSYSFDHQNEYEGDNVHPSTPMEHFYRTYLARILAQQALGLTPLPAASYVGKTVVLNVGNVLGYQQSISPAFVSQPASTNSVASISSPTMRCTDFSTLLWGTWIESRNIGGVNNVGRGNGSNATGSLLNNLLLLTSAYIGVETQAIGSSYMYIKGLPNGLAGVLTLTGSRAVTGTDRMMDITIQGVTQRLDATALTPEIKTYNFLITDNQLTIKMDLAPGSTFGYLSGVQLVFNSFTAPVLDGISKAISMDLMSDLSSDLTTLSDKINMIRTLNYGGNQKTQRNA